jgi:hypothetical protein
MLKDVIPGFLGFVLGVRMYPKIFMSSKNLKEIKEEFDT